MAEPAETPARAGELGFPDAPRSELERTIGELVERAQRVLDTESRLRHLLAANRLVVEQLELPEVLRSIAEAAVALVDARYGALGVIGPDGHLEQFIHVGMPETEADAIGHLPEGHGILGAVIDTAAPIRLEHLDADPRSSGFPAHHPHMDSFLGVPIRVRDEVFGNLYLTNRVGGPFSDEDEQLVAALAATAGIAIENARLFEQTRRRQRWSIALAEVTAALLSGEADDALGVVTDRVAALVEADVVSVVVPGPAADELTVQTARGLGAAELEGRVLPAAGTVSGRAMAGGRAVLGDAADVIRADGGPRFGPAIAVPLAASGHDFGALALARAAGAPRFTDADLEMASEFAQQASVAIELARAQADSRRLELVEDRNRIARDLHDHVIQRLFGAGLSLQGLAGTTDARTAAGIAEQVDAIDAAIAEIRTAVFTLRTGESRRGPSIRHRVLDVVSDATPHLANPPRLTFGGAVDLLVPAELADDVTAVVRELLANVARHAEATECRVDLTVTDDALAIRVHDDGRGVGDPGRRSGVAHLAERAERRGGRFDLEPAEPRGTIARWTVPLGTGNGVP